MSSIDSGFTTQERAESSESASVSSSKTPSNAPKNNRHTLEFKLKLKMLKQFLKMLKHRLKMIKRQLKVLKRLENNFQDQVRMQLGFHT